MKRFQWLGSVLSGVLLSCSDGGVTVQMGQHKFRIPRENVVGTVAPWLTPMSKNEFLFVLDPSEPKAQQISVSGEDRTVFCQDANRTQSVRVLCNSSALHWDVKGFDSSQLRRVQNADGTWLYEYPVNMHGTPLYMEVAYCSAIGSSDEGYCRSDGTYDGIVYTIGFSEARARDLVNLHKEVLAKLSQWEVR